MLVTFVQSIVSARDEYFSPLDETGREEARDHAEDDFLEKGRVHLRSKGADAVPSWDAFTRSPIGQFS